MVNIRLTFISKCRRRINTRLIARVVAILRLSSKQLEIYSIGYDIKLIDRHLSSNRFRGDSNLKQDRKVKISFLELELQVAYMIVTGRH